MPNNCTHVVEIRGDRVELEALVAAVRGTEPNDWFCFEHIVPPPPCIFQGNLSMADEEKHRGRNWNHWNRRRWGTKWSAYGQSEPVWGHGRVTFRFDTAWSFPEPVLIELSHLFPKVRIDVKAIDEGWCWAVVAMFSNGEMKWRSDVTCSKESELFQSLYFDVYGKTIAQDYEDDEEEPTDAN